MTMENREPDEVLDLTVSTVWREERVSCPHPQILHAYRNGALPAGATEYLAFHTQESACPYCNAVLEDLAAADKDAAEHRMEGLRERLLRSTVTEIRRAIGGS